MPEPKDGFLDTFVARAKREGYRSRSAYKLIALDDRLHLLAPGKTVVDLAHSFGRVAVAMGIEKATDAVALVSMGCDFGQGFLLGQPMPEERFISLLRQRAATQGRELTAQ